MRADTPTGSQGKEWAGIDSAKSSNMKSDSCPSQVQSCDDMIVNQQSETYAESTELFYLNNKETIFFFICFMSLKSTSFKGDSVSYQS